MKPFDPTPTLSPPAEERSHTVVDGKIQHLSVSQITKFGSTSEGCGLKWWYDKVAGKKEPSTRNQELGTEIHTQLEHFLRYGQDTLGKVARAAVKFLPPRSEALRLEWGLNDAPRPPDVGGKQVNHFPPEQSRVRAAGIGLVGFVDLIDLSEDHFDGDGKLVHEPGVVEVLDYKSTSNFEYSKKASVLAKTPQMLGYGVFVSEIIPTVKQVRLSHLNILTKGEPEARKESVVVDVGEIINQWNRDVNPIAERMVVAAGQKEEEVEFNLNNNACSAYRGCSHRNYCYAHKNASPFKRIKSMGLLAQRKAATPAVAVPNGAASASTTPWIPPPPPVAPRKIAVNDKSLGPQTAKEAVAGQVYKFSTGLSAAYVGPTLEGFFSFLPAGEGAKAFPVGPDEPIVYDGPVEAAPPPPPPPKPVAPPPPPAAQAAPPPPPAAQAAPPPPPAAQAVPPPPAAVKRGPGRPKKDAAATTATSATEEATGIRLFIACAPANGKYEALDGYINGILTEMQEAFGVSDIRFPPTGDHPLAFQRWEGALAAAVRAGPPAAGDYVAFRGSKIVEVVVEALIPLCGGNVVRAF